MNADRLYLCPYCGANGPADIAPKGVRRTKTLGDRQLRWCKQCRRKFTPREQRIAAEMALEELCDDRQPYPAESDPERESAALP